MQNSRCPTRSALVALLALGMLALGGCDDGGPTASALTTELRQSLIDQEVAKWTMFFRSPPEFEWYERTFSNEFVSIGDGPTGIFRSRISHADVRTGPLFPPLPPNSFTITEMMAIPVGPDAVVLSYLVAGPSPTGPNWSAYATSIWERRDGRWQTVFYQASPR